MGLDQLDDSVTVGIYCIKNVDSNKYYVCKTKDGIKRRAVNHEHRLNEGKHSNFYLQNDWHKYGEESFEVEVLETCSEGELDERHIHWVKELDAFSDGYNIIDPNEHSKGMSKDKNIDRERKKLSNSFYQLAESSKGT